MQTFFLCFFNVSIEYVICLRCVKFSQTNVDFSKTFCYSIKTKSFLSASLAHPELLLPISHASRKSQDFLPQILPQIGLQFIWAERSESGCQSKEPPNTKAGHFSSVSSFRWHPSLLTMLTAPPRLEPSANLLRVNSIPLCH